MAELDSHLTSLHFAPGKKAHATWLTLRVACLLPRSKHLRPLPYPLGAAAVVRRRNTLGSSLGNPIGRLLSFKTYMVGVKLRVALAPAIHVTLYRPDQVTPPSVFRARHAGPGTRHDPNMTWKERLEATEREALEQTLSECQGNLTKGAELFGVPRTTYREKLVKNGLLDKKEN